MMPVQIDSINIKALGPLRGKEINFRRLNLIYGKNETGKTLLVEFFLQSLFSHASSWELRTTPSTGKVLVSGITENPIDFSPGSQKKIEDYWQEREKGFPHNLAQLLVVKGGETGLSPGRLEGISKRDLTSLLTRETLLKEISEKIQTTVKKAEIIEGQIDGENRGEIKEHSLLARDCQRLSDILNEADRIFSGGPLEELLFKIDQIQNRIKIQEQAKRYQAYLASTQLENLQETKNKYPAQILQELGEKIIQHSQLEEEVTGLNQQINELKSQSETYLWINQAISTWQNQKLEEQQRPHKLLQIMGFSTLALGISALILTQFFSANLFFWIAAGLTPVGGVLIWIYFRMLTTWATQKEKNQERNALQKRFREMFDVNLTSLTDLKKYKEKYQKAFYQKETYSEQLEGKISLNRKLSNEIRNIFSDLNHPQKISNNWKSAYQNLLNDTQELNQKIRSLTAELSGLAVSKTDFQKEPAPVPYSNEELEKLREDLNNFQSQEQEILQGQERLKQRICSETGDPIDTDWPILFSNLRELLVDRKNAYRKLTARIIAGIGLNQILDGIRQQEDQHIRQEIQSPEITRLVSQFTESQQSLDLVEGEILSRGKYQNLSLNDLSTGTQDQIQLAVRMGLASILTGGEPLFLILDDAFQHSDWSRRELMVERIIQLAENRWQIIYLTMDNHLRDLFHNQGKARLKNEFTFHVLEE
jgi:uncharacterized protein YhaN